MKWLKVGAVIFGALIVTALGIDAADTISGSRSTLLGELISATPTRNCPQGMVLAPLSGVVTCIDRFEESPSSKCPHLDTQSQIDTQDNANVSDCVPESKQGAMPWRFVSLTQAQQLCARADKRLPTNDEWYKTVSGFSNQSACIVDSKKSQPEMTGSSACITPSGVSDMVGNVWEWIDGEVDDGTYNNRAVPDSGFVSLVDSDGVVLETTPSHGVETYGDDYALTAHEGVRGIIRGGFYGSGSDAGIFAQNLSVPLNFLSAGVGFRCSKDL